MITYLGAHRDITLLKKIKYSYIFSKPCKFLLSSPTKDNNKMKKSNKKNIWVPGKPMTPKAREMLESGKGAMNSDGRWTCLECNRSLSNEWTLEQHIQTVHGARTFSCDVSLIENN